MAKRTKKHEADDADDAPETADADRRPRDTRVIHRGVLFFDKGAMRTYSGDDPADLDALEKIMTTDMHNRLMARGSIGGTWEPGGDDADPPAPMPGSRADRAMRDAGGHAPDGGKTVSPEAQKQLDKLARENAKLREELDALKAGKSDA